MKKITTFLLFVLGLYSLSISAQIKNYTLLKDSTAWCYVHGSSMYGFYDYYCFMVDGDTLINGKSYKNIYKYTGEYNRQKAVYEGSMREEGQKVYCAGKRYEPDFNLDTINGETLLYNFAYGVGDTVARLGENIPCVITLIKQLEIVDGNRKIYEVNKGVHGLWIEGIGSGRYSPFRPCAQIYADYITWNLHEFVQDGKMLYNPPTLNLARDGVHWLERESGENPGEYTLINYRVIGDTLINNFLYKRVYANNYYHGAMRMNIEHKVYYCRKDMQSEILLYDFSWAPRKILHSMNYAGEDFVLVDNEIMWHYSDTTLLDLKKYLYRPLLINLNPSGVPFSSLNKDILLIECIGLTSGMFSHVETERKAGVFYNDLINFYNGNMIVYQNPAFTREGEYTSVIESSFAEKKMKITVSDGEVVFTLEEGQNLTGIKLSVYGIDGKQLSVHSMDAGVVTLTRMPKGVYYYHLDTTNGNNENGKFFCF